jgi:hypothetical protein
VIEQHQDRDAVAVERGVKNREGNTTAMAELSRRFKSTATISMKLLQAKKQWPGGARRLGTKSQRTRSLAANEVATWRHYRNNGRMFLVDPRDSHVYQLYQPSVQKKKLTVYKSG